MESQINADKRRFVFVTPLLTVDTVIIYKGKLVLIKRKNPPFQGYFALPGGFVEVGETVETAAVREAKEETGLEVRLLKLLGVYSEPSRDPRSHTVSVCFLAVGSGNLKAGSDALDTELFGINEIPELAFDHNKIIENARRDINGILSEMQEHDDARQERF
jgi:8-oxo-dGTP diphosphatase